MPVLWLITDHVLVSQSVKGKSKCRNPIHNTPLNLVDLNVSEVLQHLVDEHDSHNGNVMGLEPNVAKPEFWHVGRGWA